MKKIGIALALGAYSAFVMGGLPALTGYTVFMAMVAAAFFLTAGIIEILEVR